MKTLVQKIFILSFFLLLPSFFTWNLTGYDISWHLKAAQDLYESGSFPTRDHDSYTAEGKNWNQHSWLGGFLYFIAHSVFETKGIEGLTIFTKICTVVLSFGLAFAMTQRTAYSLFMAFFVSIAIHPLTPRPHVFSPLLAILYFHLVFYSSWYPREAVSYKRIAPYLFIFLLSALWINLHGEFVIGLLIIICVAGAALCRAYRKDRSEMNDAFLFVSAMCGFMLNPHGVGGLLYPFNAQTHPSFDWNPLTLFGKYSNYDTKEIVLYSALLFIAAAILWKGNFSRPRTQETRSPSNEVGRPSAAEWWFAIACTLLAVRYIRMTWVLIFPIMTTAHYYLARYSGGMKNGNWLLSIPTFLLLLFFPMREIQNNPAFDKPVKAIQFIKNLGIEGNVFTLSIWGGDLIYALNPQVKVFIDGRLQLYQGQIIEDYLSILSGKENACTLLEKYGTDVVLLPNESPLIHTIAPHQDWARIYTTTHETLYMKIHGNEENWNRVKMYYEKNKITINPENEFALFDVMMENAAWVKTECGFEQDEYKKIAGWVEYIASPMEQFRTEERKHESYENFGEDLYHNRFYEDAEVFLNLALKFLTDCEKGKYLLAMVLAKTGDTEQSNRLLNSIESIHQGTDRMAANPHNEKSTVAQENNRGPVPSEKR